MSDTPEQLQVELLGGPWDGTLVVHCNELWKSRFFTLMPIPGETEKMVPSNEEIERFVRESILKGSMTALSDYEIWCKCKLLNAQLRGYECPPPTSDIPADNVRDGAYRFEGQQ